MMAIPSSPKRSTTVMDEKHITTAGEELYLVHLRRLREEEDDHDHLPRKRRSSSIGEELWEIHRRRSVGIIEDDDDNDNAFQDTKMNLEENSNNQAQVKEGSNDNTKSQKPTSGDSRKFCRYYLRSRDASTHKKS